MMTNSLPPVQLESLLPALRHLAELVQKSGPPSREDLQLLLLASGLDEDWAVSELERWAKVLAAVRGQTDAGKRDIVQRGLMLRGVPEAPAKLAVEMAAAPAPAPPPKPTTLPIQVSPEAIGFGELKPGQGTQGTLTVSGGPGRVKVGSDTVTVQPETFGPDETTLTVAVKGGLDGQVLWDTLNLESETESVKVDLTARWATPVEVVDEPVVVAPPPPPRRRVEIITPRVEPAAPKLPPGLVSRNGKVFRAKDDAEMVLIPAGEFQMGSNDVSDDEKPVHTVYLDAFYMDVYEVTNAHYKQFMDATEHKVPGYWNNSNYNAPDQPVVGVSWYDAAAYCQWVGVRLPTEAEWEKAARGGLVGKKYPWGDSIDSSKVNYGSNVGKPTPVGKYPPNGYGLYDMVGNVWEWCQDGYDSDFYAQSPKNNPVAGGIITFVNNSFTNVKILRVCRGGSWGSDPNYVRVANRSDNYPTYAGSLLGFRCAGPVTP